MAIRTCTICGTQRPADQPCPVCTKAVPHWRDPASMTPQERVNELLSWLGPIEIPLSILFDRVDALVGHYVSPTDLLFPQGLISEIMGEEDPPTEKAVEIITRLLGPDRVILVDFDGSLADKARRQ